MELEKYLRGLEECSDVLFADLKKVQEGQLTNVDILRKRRKYQLVEEFGIGDNWPVLLSIDYDELINDLNNSVNSDEFFAGQYKLDKRISWKDNRPEWPGLNMSEGAINNIFDYVPGIMKLQVYNEVSEGCCIWDEPDYVHQKKQVENFNVHFFLHPYQEKKIEGISNLKAISQVVIDMGRYAQKKGVPLCFPFSTGYKYEDDFSRTVYFDLKK